MIQEAGWVGNKSKHNQGWLYFILSLNLRAHTNAKKPLLFNWILSRNGFLDKSRLEGENSN
jgi:hypothetical protein